MKRVLLVLFLFCALLILSPSADAAGDISPAEPKVILDCNGGVWEDGATAPQIIALPDTSITVGDVTIWNLELSLYSQRITCNGHILTGWNTSRDGSGVQLSMDIQYVPGLSNPPTLYAQWAVGTQPSVVFDSNGGTFDGSQSNAPSREYRLFPLSAEMKPPTVFREGFTFVGWFNDPISTFDPLSAATQIVVQSDIFYLPGEPVASEKPIHLAARWIPNHSDGHLIVHHINTPDVTFENGNKRCAISFIRTPDHSLDFKKSGYYFTGWNTRPDGTGMQLNSNQGDSPAPLYNDSRIIQLYAQWEPLNFPQNYCVFVDENQIFENGRTYLAFDRTSPVSIPLPAAIPPFPAEYWESDAPTTDERVRIPFVQEPVLINQNAYFHPASPSRITVGDVTVTSKTLFISPNGGTFASPPVGPFWYKDYSSTITGSTVTTEDEPVPEDIQLCAQNLSRSGYALIGFNSKPDGSGVPYHLGDSFAFSANTEILYAQWKPGPYTAIQDGSKYIVTLPGSLDSTVTPWLAAYDTAGKMIGISAKPSQLHNSLTFSGQALQGAANLKLFSLDQDNSPTEEVHSITLLP